VDLRGLGFGGIVGGAVCKAVGWGVGWSGEAWIEDVSGRVLDLSTQNLDDLLEI
jgi:hypothetical protein